MHCKIGKSLLLEIFCYFHQTLIETCSRYIFQSYSFDLKFTVCDIRKFYGIQINFSTPSLDIFREYFHEKNFFLHTLPLNWQNFLEWLKRDSDKIIFRSTQKRCSIKKLFLKNSQLFTGKHLCWSLFFQHRRFPVNITKFLRTPILKNICKWLLLNILEWFVWEKKSSKLKVYI